MKKILLMAVAGLMAISAIAQTTVKKVRVYAGNTVVFEQKYAAVDSVVFFDEIIPVQVETNGALPGEFSVSANKKVKFSKGNLQYVNSTWQFAENQLDRSVDVHAGVDYFGWGTGDAPLKNSMINSDYSTFHEWGANPIANGGNEANMWRTPTKDEWVYLFHGRTNASKLFGFGTVNGVEGVIILPDNWVTPDGITFNPNTMSWSSSSSGSGGYGGGSDNFSKNYYNQATWNTMQAIGAVFLPATQYQDEWFGGYWSATPYDSNNAYSLEFDKTFLSPQYVCLNCNPAYSARYLPYSVRLVQDVE